MNQAFLYRFKARSTQKSLNDSYASPNLPPKSQTLPQTHSLPKGEREKGDEIVRRRNVVVAEAKTISPISLSFHPSCCGKWNIGQTGRGESCNILKVICQEYRFRSLEHRVQAWSGEVFALKTWDMKRSLQVYLNFFYFAQIVCSSFRSVPVVSQNNTA